MKSFFTLLLLSIVFFSCKKETETAICFTGKVHWGGSQALDGIEWMIFDTATNTQYKVVDPGNNYRQHDLIVNVCLTKTNETYPCYCAGPVYIYRINSISC
jgi:hypothetical protein